MDALLIANPHASTTNDRIITDIHGVLSRRFTTVGVETTSHRHHATELARQAVADGVGLVATLGGDGTANEVIQALAGTDVSLAVLPGGGANVLARTLGLPEDPAQAARMLLPDDAGLTSRRIGLGRANERWFAVSAGLGFDASVVEAVERHPRVKHLLRDAAFVSIALGVWFRSQDRHEVPLEIELADGSVHRGFWVVLASNSDPFTFLGSLPMRVTPGVRFEDGIDVMAVRAASTAHVLRLVGRVFAGARHQRDPSIAMFRDLESLTIRASTPRPFQVDGDAAGISDTLEIVHSPHALSVLVAG